MVRALWFVVLLFAVLVALIIHELRSVSITLPARVHIRQFRHSFELPPTLQYVQVDLHYQRAHVPHAADLARLCTALHEHARFLHKFNTVTALEVYRSTHPQPAHPVAVRTRATAVVVPLSSHCTVDGKPLDREHTAVLVNTRADVCARTFLVAHLRPLLAWDF